MPKKREHSSVRKSTGGEGLPPRNFTVHQSDLSEEGRRNQPQNMSPKKTKKRQTEEHKAEVEIRKELGALRGFTS